MKNNDELTKKAIILCAITFFILSLAVAFMGFTDAFASYLFVKLK